jgi:hypothetical protein
MLNRTSLLTAVCLASAGLFVASAPAADNVTITSNGSSVTADMNSHTALPAGITAKNLNDDKAIDKAIKNVAEDGLSRDGFDNLVGRLADQDRDRIKKSAGNASLTNLNGDKNQRLNTLVDNLNNSFKAKYSQKVDIDYSKAFTADFVHIMTGEVQDPNQLVGKWPVAAGMSADNAGKLSAADAQQAQNKAFGGDVNLEKGRDVAIAHIVGSHGMPGVTASLIHEVASGWKFDIPNDIDAHRLYNNLLSNLGTINTSTLPADVNEANREVAHAVVASLYNIDLSNGSNAANLNGARPMNVPANSNTGTVNNR